MPKQYSEQARIELGKIIKNAAEKELKRIQELKNQGLWIGGLDGDNGEFDDINAETEEKIKALAKKYGAAHGDKKEKGA